MPVQKFRSQQEASRALWLPSGSPEIARRMRVLWGLARRLHRPKHRPGLCRFRSIDDPARRQYP